MTDKVKTPDGLPDLSKAEVEKAKHDGAVEYIKDGVAGTMASDTGTTGDADAAAEAQAKRVRADLNTTPLEPLLNLGLDAFKDTVSEDADKPIDEDSIRGLLALERNGRNRTDYVRALMKRLDVKSPYEVTHGGPGYTNDVSNVTVVTE